MKRPRLTVWHNLSEQRAALSNRQREARVNGMLWGNTIISEQETGPVNKHKWIDGDNRERSPSLTLGISLMTRNAEADFRLNSANVSPAGPLMDPKLGCYFDLCVLCVSVCHFPSGSVCVFCFFFSRRSVA